MPNHIQNWDMAYAMSFQAVNNKLSADFNANNVAKEKIRTSVSTIAANHDATVVLQQVIEAAITGLGYTATIPKPATFDLETCKTTIATAFTNHLLLQDKYKSPYLKYLETKKKDHPDKKEYETQITQEKTYLETVVKIQVQNAVLAVAANKETKFEDATEEVIKEMIKEAVAVMYPQNCCDRLFVNDGTDKLNINLEAWSLRVGSKTDRVLVEIPFNMVDKAESGKFLVELNLNWVKATQQTFFENAVTVTSDLVFKINHFVQIKMNNTKTAKETLFEIILNNLTATNSTKSSSIGYLYNRLFASLNVFETLGVTSGFEWMYPTTVEYTTIDSNDLEPKLEDSVFGILCMTGGRKNKEKPAIDINIIPKGNGSAIIFTPALLMQNIIKPKIMDLFCKDEDKINKAADTNFTEITPTSFESDKDLYFVSTIANKAESNSTINPKISANTFSFALDNNSLVLNFGEMTYNWEENENFKVALQHKMKGSFSTKDKDGNWIVIKEDSSVITPNVTPEPGFSPGLQKTLDWVSTPATTLLTSLVFEKWAKYYFIENATKSVSSIYHNHVTNDMEALQTFLSKQSEIENKKFIADLNANPGIKGESITGVDIYFFVEEISEDYLVVKIPDATAAAAAAPPAPPAAVAAAPNAELCFSLKIIPTKSEFDDGGMLLINKSISASTPALTTIKTFSSREEMTPPEKKYMEYLSPIRRVLKTKLAEIEKNKKFIADLTKHKLLISAEEITCRNPNFRFSVTEISGDCLIVKLVSLGTTVTFGLQIIPTKSESNEGGMQRLMNDDAKMKKMKKSTELSNSWDDTYKNHFDSIRQALKNKINLDAGNNQVLPLSPPEPIMPFLNVAIGTTTGETQEFIKQLHDKGLGFTDIVLETKMASVVVKNITLDDGNVTLTLKMDIGSVVLKTNSKKNEYGGFEKYEENTITEPMKTLWMETNKAQLQEIRYALTLRIYRAQVFQEFREKLTGGGEGLNKLLKWLNKQSIWKREQLKVGDLVLEKEFIDITEDKVRIALKGVNYWYPYLGLELSPNEVKLYGLNTLATKDLNEPTNWKAIEISDFEELYPDSVRQMVNELKRVAFAKIVTPESREFIIDFFKDSFSGTLPIIISKLSELYPPTDPTNDINNQGKIKNLEGVVNKTLQAIKWPGEASNDLKLDSMDLNGNFRLSFHSLLKLLKGVIEKENQDQLIYTFPSYNAGHTVSIENTGDVDLTFHLENNPPVEVKAKAVKKEYKLSNFGTTGTQLSVKAALKHDPPTTVASYTVFIKEI